LHLPRLTPLAVRFGPPMHFSRDGARGRDARHGVTQRIMNDIAALLP